MVRPKSKNFKSKTIGKGNKSKKNFKHSKINVKKHKNNDKKNQHGGGQYNKDSRKHKNFKHIQRNREAEEAFLRQKQIELKYKAKQNEFLRESDDDSEEEVKDQFEELLSTLGTDKNQKAIESSSEESDDDDEENDLLESEENDDSDGIESDELNSDDSNSMELRVSDDNDGSEELPPPKKKTKIDNEIVAESEEEIEEEIDLELLEKGKEISEKDPFCQQLDCDLSPELLNAISSIPQLNCVHELNWPILGRIQIEIPKCDGILNANKSKKKSLISLDDEENFAPEGTVPKRIDHKNVDLKELYVKVQIEKNVATANEKALSKEGHKLLTPIQAELFSLLNNYQDVYYPQRTLKNGEDIRFVYCLHALNHVLKTRMRILHHNARLGKMAGESKKSVIVPDHFRDQGLVRPKVLIVLPFRESAYRCINTLIALLTPQLGGSVINHKRFLDEFTGDSLVFPVKNPKPEDYEQTFAGNTDDTFRIGISLTKKCIKLYSEFYSSDILIASPLGLRLIIGAAGEKEREFDFLASIEMLILDQTEIFYAQNWDHLLHTLDHLHLQPQSASNTDFSRVRSWSLNGWSRFYRQTILLSSHQLPEFRSLFNQRCLNHRGKARILNPVEFGTIRNVFVQIPQVFHRIDVATIESSFDKRFNHFVSTILPQYRTSATMAHCLVYVPSYFDYVRIRNHFKKETVNFVQICEYTKDEKIARARDMFFHSSAHFMLYSERAHFFRRTRIKGVRHIIFYQPPNFPHFYPEIINLMQEENQNKRDGGANSMTVTILYTKYDVVQVAEMVGSEKAGQMIKSDKTTHMFMTGD